MLYIDPFKLDCMLAKRGKTNTQLIREAKVGTTFSRFVRNHTPFHPVTVGKVARVLDCDVMDLIEEGKTVGRMERLEQLAERKTETPVSETPVCV